ncbi:MAG: ATP-grasp domain-containing protein [Clostridia bacterium]|nr:ATP-grasp domain-containing protein [Clostridia bacterium]
MVDVKGKKLLVLGGTSASLDIVKNARSMGIYTVVTDDAPTETRVAKQIADETALVSTADIDALAALVRECGADGVFCGPSEFNLRNVIKLCEQTGLPCYTTTEVWDRCANKDVFKSYCREYGVDCTPEYAIDRDTPSCELEGIDYPIIIKPVDGSSSAGISVCRSAAEVPAALDKAYAASKSKKIIAEKYIENGGEIFSVRYLLRDGEAYPYFMMDTYVADPIHRTSLISGFTHAPSKHAEYYMRHMDGAVRRMLKGMGLKNGTAFIQSLPYGGKIYFHEMGYRLSGGMMFKLTEPLVGINDMKLMIRYAVGGDAVTDGELQGLDLTLGGRIGAQLMMPLDVGTIGRIEGVDKVTAHPAVVDYMQYYNVGDTVEKKNIGTLGQHFCRVTFICDSEREAVECLEYFRDSIVVYDTNGERMNRLLFDTSRLERD